jgi:hypothetical protein
LLISLVFFVLSCYVSVYSEFRVAHFYSFVLCCPVMYLYVLSSVLLISIVFMCCSIICLYVLNSMLLNSLVFFVLSCYVSLCSEFRVAYFFFFFLVSCFFYFYFVSVLPILCIFCLGPCCSSIVIFCWGPCCSSIVVFVGVCFAHPL